MKNENGFGFVVLAILLGAMFFASQGQGCSPNPPKPPSGPRTILLWYESQEVPAEFNNLTLTELRAGEPGKYLEEKGHLLLTMDPDQPQETTRKDVQAAIAQAKVQGAPAIVVVDSSNASVIGSAKLDYAWTADQVIDIIKANGG